MQNPIRIVATKKLSERQKQQLLRADFSVFDEDFISIQSKIFEIENINDYLIFTSQNAVESVLKNKKITEIKSKRCFCVGEKTKVLLEQNDFDVIADSDYAAELASIICNQYSKNSFAFFCGNIRRDVLPEALVAVNPTRGLDIRSTAFVHEQIRLARAGGAAIVLISTDLDELAALADRTHFLSRGRLSEGASSADLLGGPA